MGLQEEYFIIAEGKSGEIEEKKSRFIANVFSVSSEEEALSHINAVKKKYWDARHNCYAFIIGKKQELMRCSDDGEPQGTAGKPILEVIKGKELCNVLVVVTRYFGGTLLGTGGLVRAYTDATKAGLEASKMAKVISGKRLLLETDYNSVGKLLYIMGSYGIEPEVTYTDIVEAKVVIKDELVDRIIKELTEATSGQMKIVIDGSQELLEEV